PRLNRLISTFFEKEPLIQNPENTISLGNIYPSHLIISLGTAIGCKCFERDIQEKELPKLKMTSYSIGIETQDGKFVVMIPKNTPIPVKTTRTFPNITDEDEKITLSIYEGEQEIAKNNH